jgi:signal transduction histidine kinase
VNDFSYALKYNDRNSKLKDEKLWFVADSLGKIYYSNETGKNEINLREGDNIFSLSCEPSFEVVFQNLRINKIQNFSFDVLIEHENNFISYFVEIEATPIEGLDVYVIVFSSPFENSELENRINNLHYALEFGNVPILITDAKGKITYATKSFERLLELEIDAIYNNSLASVLSLNLGSQEIIELQTAILLGKSWSSSISLKGKDNESSTYDLRLKPVIINGLEKRSFIFTAHDVSYYVQKNRMIKKLSEKQRNIINNISDLVLILKLIDSKIIFEDGNDKYFQVFGINEAAKKEKKLNDCIEEKLYDKIWTSINILKKNNLKSIEFDYESPEERHYASRITIMPGEKIDEELLIISLKDITERIIQEEQVKAAYKKEMQMNRLKTTFLQNMSHELRTPATAVIGYSEIIQECIDSKDYEAVGEITAALDNVVQRMINLFSKILEISELESEEAVFETVKMNCNKILLSVYSQKKNESDKKGLDFNLEMGNFYDLIEVDWNKLEKALLYLVDNAIKFTDTGSVQLTSRKTGDTVQIEIIDTGCGMNQKTIDWLLEPFVQENPDGHTREYEGAGLGLTIAYKYIKQMNGKFFIESEKNVGTKILIEFPISTN